MRGMFIAGSLALLLIGCSGAEPREDEPWEADDPNDSTEAFDQRLKQKRIQDAESMEQARAVAARLAAQRGKRLEDVAGEEAGGEASAGGSDAPLAAATLDREACPPDGNLKYTCQCAGGAKPSWANTLGPAWKMQDGYWYAVGEAPSMKDPSMASDRAFNRALVKIAAALKGQPGFSEAPDQQIKAFLKGAESREVHREADGRVLALARYRADKPIPQAVIEAKCPETGKAPYACDCPAGQTPAWLDLKAWRGGDGYAYGVGTSPGTSKEPERRARGRANRSLMVFLSGLTIQAGPIAGGRQIKGYSEGSIDNKRVQIVAEQDHGPGKAVLVRFWIGE